MNALFAYSLAAIACKAIHVTIPLSKTVTVIKYGSLSFSAPKFPKRSLRILLPFFSLTSHPLTLSLTHIACAVFSSTGSC